MRKYEFTGTIKLCHCSISVIYHFMGQLWNISQRDYHLECTSCSVSDGMIFVNMDTFNDSEDLCKALHTFWGLNKKMLF